MEAPTAANHILLASSSPLHAQIIAKKITDQSQFPVEWSLITKYYEAKVVFHETKPTDDLEGFIIVLNLDSISPQQTEGYIERTLHEVLEKNNLKDDFPFRLCLLHKSDGRKFSSSISTSLALLFAELDLPYLTGNFLQEDNKASLEELRQVTLMSFIDAELDVTAELHNTLMCHMWTHMQRSSPDAIGSAATEQRELPSNREEDREERNVSEGRDEREEGEEGEEREKGDEEEEQDLEHLERLMNKMRTIRLNAMSNTCDDKTRRDNATEMAFSLMKYLSKCGFESDGVEDQDDSDGAVSPVLN